MPPHKAPATQYNAAANHIKNKYIKHDKQKHKCNNHPHTKVHLNLPIPTRISEIAPKNVCQLSRNFFFCQHLHMPHT